MDDSDVCPLCCEELDISDRQFFPCKCGYQVCMWCWHRIRESESGLCPACRTPYGDDPHEFSAVDMEDVVKANKEKAAAEKREKERHRQQHAAAAAITTGGTTAVSMGYGSGIGVGTAVSLGGMHIGGGSDCDLALVTSSSGTRGGLDPPRDRNQLANMRVIRRNLVYAVGLPPSLATEDQLRKPEYFGQYGKIAKIVLNRNHTGNGDPRRASASAYVTFVHKEDTLACILALDGFYLDGRNIRASYGTSKYCSAFIKNVRCNNPDCTYLHSMGEAEDTFTKHEIQAGYVTSGRDVLARQQQLAAAASGTGISLSKRRVGGGGPSGTGKIPTGSVLPPPTFDEPNKSSPTNAAPVPPSTTLTSQFPPVNIASLGKSASVGVTGMCAVAPSGVSGSSAAAVPSGKFPRSVSVSIPPATTNTHQPTPPDSILTSGLLVPTEKLTRQQEQLRKMHPQNAVKSGAGSVGTVSQKLALGSICSSSSNAIDTQSAVPVSNSQTVPTQATAASIVAGVRIASLRSDSAQPASHTTLTPLTPLKRASSMPEKKDSGAANGRNNPIPTAVNDNSGDVVKSAAASKLSEQTAILERRNEMTVLTTKQQEMVVKVNALRSRNIKECEGSNHQGTTASGSGTASSSPTSSISSASGPSVSELKTSMFRSDNDDVCVGVIGGTVIGREIVSSVSGPGAIGPVVNRKAHCQTLAGRLSSHGGTGSAESETFSDFGLLRGGSAPAPSLNVGSIGGTSLGVSGVLDNKMPDNGILNSNGQGSAGGVNSFATPSTSSSLFTGTKNDKWASPSQAQTSGSGGMFGKSDDFDGHKGSDVWRNKVSQRTSTPIPIGPSNSSRTVGASFGGPNSAGIVGGHIIGHGMNHNTGQDPSALRRGLLSSNSGSSTLASMSGIELPSRLGSLRESLWASSMPISGPVGGQTTASSPTPIGPGARPGTSLVFGGGLNTNGGLGGVPIGGYGRSNTGTIGGSNISDIALLQSLLPGVHITSGNAFQPAAQNSGGGAVIGGGWGSLSGLPPAPAQQQRSQHQQQFQPSFVGRDQQQQQQELNDTWGNSGLYTSALGPTNHVSHQHHHQQQQHQHQQHPRHQQKHQSNIW